jgi:C4-dicarboxylate-specific signal transduction histidine kinase
MPKSQRDLGSEFIMAEAQPESDPGEVSADDVTPDEVRPVAETSQRSAALPDLRAAVQATSIVATILITTAMAVLVYVICVLRWSRKRARQRVRSPARACDSRSRRHMCATAARSKRREEGPGERSR